MARVLEEWPAAARRRRAPNLNYDELFDGRVHELMPGEDFFGKPESAMAAVRRAASARDLDVDVGSYAGDSGTHVVVRTRR